MSSVRFNLLSGMRSTRSRPHRAMISTGTATANAMNGLSNRAMYTGSITGNYHG